PQLSLRRVGAKCTLSFFGFPKGNPMVHGELASRRPVCILGGVAPQQRESLAVLLARLRSDSPCTIGSPFYISLWDTARRPPRTVKSPQLSLRRVGAKCTLSFFGFPKGNPMVHGELASRRPVCILGGVAPQQRESLAVLLARLRSDSPCTIGSPFYISLWDTARRPPRTVKSPQLSLRRVGAKCTLSFFGFPKGNPMVHGELASRRPGCILGGVAPQQRESLAVLLSRLRSDSPCTIGPPFYISLWDTARRPPRTVKSPQLSLRRVGAKCTLSFFPSRRGSPST